MAAARGRKREEMVVEDSGRQTNMGWLAGERVEPEGRRAGGVGVVIYQWERNCGEQPSS